MSVSLDQIFSFSIDELLRVLHNNQIVNEKDKSLSFLRKETINFYLLNNILIKESEFIVKNTSFMKQDLNNNLNDILYESLFRSLTSEIDMMKQQIIINISVKNENDYNKVFKKSMNKKYNFDNPYKNSIDLIKKTNDFKILKDFENFLDNTQRDWGYLIMG
jgi:hypothetical protein